MSALLTSQRIAPPRHRSFYVMLALALVVHVLGVVIASLIPPRAVKDIPVRALSFKIGDVVPLAPEVPAEPTIAETTDPLVNDEWQASDALLPPPPVIAPADAPVRHVRTQPVATPPAPTPEVEQPQRFVRQEGTLPPPVSAADIFGDVPVNPELAAPVEVVEAVDVKTKYQQQIAAWLNRHKLYPAQANGVAGKTIVRMRVDRAGYVRYYALEESSGHAVLDKAAIDMVRRANPVPAAPAGYPAGSLIEFLVPIVFTAP